MICRCLLVAFNGPNTTAPTALLLPLLVAVAEQWQYRTVRPIDCH